MAVGDAFEPKLGLKEGGGSVEFDGLKLDRLAGDGEEFSGGNAARAVESVLGEAGFPALSAGTCGF